LEAASSKKNPDWNGNIPTSDEGKKAMILEAAIKVASEHGVTKVSIQRVAKELNITRQTVYRLYPSSNALRNDVAVASGGDVLEAVVERSKQYDNFPDSAIASIVFLAINIPKDPYLKQFFLGPGDNMGDVETTFSHEALEYCYQMLLAVHPGPEEEIDEKWVWDLTEYIVRILLTLIVVKTDSIDTEAKMTSYLDRWLRPVLTP